MKTLLPGLALFFAMLGCGGDDDDDSGGSSADAAPSGSDASSADASPQADAAILGDAALGAYPVQIIRPACAPNDAPALRILLGSRDEGDPCAVDPASPSVVIDVWSRDIEAPSIFAWAPGEETGSGTLCPAGEESCVTPDTGQIGFDTFEDGVSATGSWEIDDGDDEETGAFTATWCEPAMPEPCG